MRDGRRDGGSEEGAEGGAAEMGAGFRLISICDIANTALVLVFSNIKNPFLVLQMTSIIYVVSNFHTKYVSPR